MTMRRHRGKRRSSEPAELNVTAFLNLMVVLVPFLLITAVFSRITILQLNLPEGGAANSGDQLEFQVEVIVRGSALEIGDGEKVIHRIGNRDEEGYDFRGLSEVLLEIKKNYPDMLKATILVEPDIRYETVVAVMDATRSTEVAQIGGTQRVELFPQVSIGDAPGAAQEG
jgi:Biopolymer transport protein